MPSYDVEKLKFLNSKFGESCIPKIMVFHSHHKKNPVSYRIGCTSGWDNCQRCIDESFARQQSFVGRKKFQMLERRKDD